MKTMISAQNVTKSFPATDPAGGPGYVLNDVSLVLERGKIGTIIGRSGAGKSTLLHLIAGLDIPDQGRCYIGNELISSKDEESRARLRLENIGIVFQSFNFLESLTLRENIMIPSILLNSISREETAERIYSVSRLLGIEHALERQPGDVSGGELQRACIARAMVNNPKVILADEPTGNLDTSNRKKVLESLVRVRNRFEVAVLIVTHDQEISRSADSIFHLKDGKIEQFR